MANLKGKKKGTRHTTQPIKEWDKVKSLLKRMKKEHKAANTRLMFACGFYTAYRIGDILSLTWSDLLGEHIEIIEDKTDKNRKVAISETLRQIINETHTNMYPKPKEDDYVFIVQKVIRGKERKPISVTAANKRVAKYFKKYKIKVANPSSHTLRKTFAYRVYDTHGRTDAILHKLAKILNHSSVSTTMDYIGITASDIEEIYLSVGAID